MLLHFSFVVGLIDHFLFLLCVFLLEMIGLVYLCVNKGVTLKIPAWRLSIYLRDDNIKAFQYTFRSRRLNENTL